MNTNPIISLMLSAGIIGLAACSGSEKTETEQTSADINADDKV